MMWVDTCGYWWCEWLWWFPCCSGITPPLSDVEAASAPAIEEGSDGLIWVVKEIWRDSSVWTNPYLSAEEWSDT